MNIVDVTGSECSVRQAVSIPPQPYLRTGAAVVEFALALPMLFLILFGSIQACNAIFTKQFITEVTYQGAMTASRPGADMSAVLAELDQLLAARGIDAATIEVVGIDETPYDQLSTGELFKVSVTVSSATNQSAPAVATFAALQAESIGRKQ